MSKIYVFKDQLKVLVIAHMTDTKQKGVRFEGPNVVVQKPENYLALVCHSTKFVLRAAFDMHQALLCIHFFVL